LWKKVYLESTIASSEATVKLANIALLLRRFDPNKKFPKISLSRQITNMLTDTGFNFQIASQIINLKSKIKCSRSRFLGFIFHISYVLKNLRKPLIIIF